MSGNSTKMQHPIDELRFFWTNDVIFANFACLTTKKAPLNRVTLSFMLSVFA